MSRLFRATRSSNWWEAKLPLVLAVAYAQIAVVRLDAAVAFPILASLLVSAISLASAAHVWNDIFDLDSDAVAGKENAVRQLGRGRAVALASGLVAIGLLPWTVIYPGLYATISLAAICALPLVYSAPPARLKDRGIFGVIADASFAHLGPALFVSFLVIQVSEGANPTSRYLTFAIAIWSLIVGLRAILVHQMRDARFDEVAGTRTFVVEQGIDRVESWVRGVLFPLEIALLVGVALLLGSVAPLLVAFFVSYAGIYLVARELWPELPLDAAPLVANHPIALFEFYKVWPGLVLAVYLGSREPVYFVLVIAHFVLFRAPVTRQLVGIRSRAIPFLWKGVELARRLARVPRRRSDSV